MRAEFRKGAVFDAMYEALMLMQRWGSLLQSGHAACVPPQAAARPQTAVPIAAESDLDTLLRESDVISLHCPLFPKT